MVPAKEPKDKQANLRASEAQLDRWQVAARGANLSMGAWMRATLDAAALGRLGGVAPPRDDEFSEALAGLQAAYGISDGSQVIRMAVLAAARRLAAGQDPFRVELAREAAPPEAPHPTTKNRKGR